MTDPYALSRRMQLAKESADEAGQITLAYFQKASLAVQQKGDGSPVTIADREAELFLRRQIERAFPHDAILGEEHGEKAGTSGFRWLLDPVDGTKSFIHGVPLYGTLIGIEHNGDPVAGVILMPALGESVSAARGLGATLRRTDREDDPARVSDVPSMPEALMCTTGFDYWRPHDREPLLVDVCRRFRTTRGWSDCYGYLLLATGRVDAVIEPMVHPWDVAAVIPIIEEAGGRATDWSGARTAYTNTSVATNARFHDDLVALLRGR